MKETSWGVSRQLSRYVRNKSEGRIAALVCSLTTEYRCCETFRFYRSDLFSAATTSNIFGRAINRETQKARGALYRGEEKAG